ncbi:hypothetical protein C8Q78DRAFT_205862 [Trametes maxima]|nr:hypothetical protein C8Q78DRAFT_205862 [Trametes maxima]
MGWSWVQSSLPTHTPLPLRPPECLPEYVHDAIPTQSSISSWPRLVPLAPTIFLLAGGHSRGCTLDRLSSPAPMGLATETGDHQVCSSFSRRCAGLHISTVLVTRVRTGHDLRNQKRCRASLPRGARGPVWLLYSRPMLTVTFYLVLRGVAFPSRSSSWSHSASGPLSSRQLLGVHAPEYAGGQSNAPEPTASPRSGLLEDATPAFYELEALSLFWTHCRCGVMGATIGRARRSAAVPPHGHSH